MVALIMNALNEAAIQAALASGWTYDQIRDQIALDIAGRQRGECRCGRRISENKAMCFACATEAGLITT
jgi:hypothetical protein